MNDFLEGVVSADRNIAVMKRRSRARALWWLLVLLQTGCASFQSSPPAAPKNVILMINDGAGWGTWDAAAYWQYGSRQGAPYAAFPVKLGMSTYPLNTQHAPTHDTISHVGYEPAKAWDRTPTQDATRPFAGYQYLDTGATDSAAAGTALSSGVKTYNSALNHDNFGCPLTFAAQVAKRAGKAVGVVTSVPFSHATPAAFAAQNRSRQNYHQIARQMLSEGNVDVIMGTGGPGFDVNGVACTARGVLPVRAGCEQPDEFVATEDWQRLQRGQYTALGSPHPWQLIRTKEQFSDLAQGRLVIEGPVIGVPNIAKTLQQQRQADALPPDTRTPSGIGHVASVPTLEMMTRGALAQLLRRSPENGFFLMIEAGATDWAGHTSRCGTQWRYGACTEEPQYGRLIEETVDFNDAVTAVIEWIQAHGGWRETLLIVTTDHDNSMPMGPHAQTRPFEPVINRGKGHPPGLSFRPTGNHSNALVPLWAKGAGAEQFAKRVRGTDSGYATYVGWNDGQYIDNTDVAVVMHAALEGGSPVAPATPIPSECRGDPLGHGSER